MGIDSSNPVTKRLNFEQEARGVAEENGETSARRGTRDHPAELQRVGIRHVGGRLELIPTAVEAALLLPWILCGTTSGSPTVTYNLGDTLATRFVTVDRVDKVFTYDTVGV